MTGNQITWTSLKKTHFLVRLLLIQPTEIVTRSRMMARA